MPQPRNSQRTVGVVRRVAWCIAAVFVAMMTSRSSAQCAGQWIPEMGVSGTDNTVWAMAAYDPDGPGPLGMHVGMTGYFVVAGDVRANRVALYDPTTGEWKNLGTGLGGSGFAMTTMAGGDLVVGGSFASAGGVLTSNIARWNGSAWSALGPGLNGTVFVMHALPNGDLLAGGTFTRAGDLVVNGLARWDGTEWTGFGAGFGGSGWSVTAIEVLPSGDIIAGGGFTTAGGVTAKAIARWNGSSWSPMGGAFLTGYANRTASVGAIRRLSNGDLIAGGDFYTVGNTRVNNIARWDGSAWMPMGGGLAQATPQVKAIIEMSNGNVLACGSFGYTHTNMENMSVWDGSEWTLYNGGVGGGITGFVQLPNGEVFVGGQFDDIGAYLSPAGDAGIAASNVARWTGSSWTPLGAGFVGKASSLLQLPDGDVLAAANLGGSIPRYAVVKRSGTRWSTLLPSTGSAYLTKSIEVMTLDPQGSLYVCGDAIIWRFTDEGWVSVAPGLTGQFEAMAFLPNHDLVVGGNLTLPGGTRVPVARWNGSAWSSMPGLTTPLTDLRALEHLPNGDLIAGGHFTIAGGDADQGIARWNGSAWVPFPSPNPGGTARITSLRLCPSGNLVATAKLTPPANGPNEFVLRWNGAAWSIIPGNFSSSIEAAAELSDGSIVAGGSFHSFGGVPFNTLAIWNGSSWSAMGSGVEGAGGPRVRSLMNLANGDLLVAGEFSIAGGQVSGPIATWRNGAAPGITSQPVSQRACNTGSGSFSVVAQGDSTLTYRWRYNTQPIDTSLNPSAATATFTIVHASSADAGLYDCVVTNACASVTSHAAQLKVCASDFNCDGAIDFFDFDDFVVCFEEIACPPGITADVDHDGTVDFFDYDLFINAFETPC